jgi:hypothetical protein
MADDKHGVDPEPGSDEDAHSAAEPSIEAVLGKYLAGMDGWNGITDQAGALRKQRTEQAAAMKRQANDFRDCFATPAGRRVLDHFYDMTLRTRPYPADAMLAMDVIVPLVMAHDAACNFVAAIRDAIDVADDRAPKPRSTP